MTFYNSYNPNTFGQNQAVFELGGNSYVTFQTHYETLAVVGFSVTGSVGGSADIVSGPLSLVGLSYNFWGEHNYGYTYTLNQGHYGTYYFEGLNNGPDEWVSYANDWTPN